MPVWMATLCSVAVVSAIPILGLVTLRREAALRRVLPWLVGFAAGGLLGGAVLNLLPAAVERLGSGPLPGGLLLVGFLGSYLLEVVLIERRPGGGRIPPLAALNLVGDALHNFIDGVIIAGSFQVTTGLGLTTTLAVILHEVPQEIGDFAILLHSGMPIRRAIYWNVVSACAAMAGALVTLAAGEIARANVVLLLPIAAGSFLYLAGSRLVPELRTAGGRQALGHLGLMVAGIALLGLVGLID